MDADPSPALQIHRLTTTLTSEARGFQSVMLQNLLSEAHRQNDATFTFCRELRITVHRDAVETLDCLALRRGWRCLRVGSHSLLIRSLGMYAAILCGGPSESCAIEIELWADTQKRIVEAESLLMAELLPFRITDIAFSLNWRFVTGKGDIGKASTEERPNGVLLDEAYPVLAPVQEFIKQFLSAPESVLVLQGTPGTGKTRLIRSVLTELSRRKGASAEVLYTGDTAVLDNDEIYLEFVTGDQDAFVVEDADHLLTPRCEGNHTLHRFLNIADGVAQAHGRKIIFSTNLPLVREIDEALVRPGRCFAHVVLAELGPTESHRLLGRLCGDNAQAMAPALTHLEQAGKKSHSVADIYAAHRRALDPAPPAVRRLGVPRARRAFGFGGSSEQKSAEALG